LDEVERTELWLLELFSRFYYLRLLLLYTRPSSLPSLGGETSSQR
jgi:hypothetical protein